MRKGYCVHFRGVQHDTCLAGVDMRSKRDVSSPGPAQWPCCPPMRPGQVCATTCDQYLEPTAEQIAESDKAINEMLVKFRKRMKEGICNDCDTKIQGVKQVGPCVYAEPCGHRIGQGDAEKMRKQWGL